MVNNVGTNSSSNFTQHNDAIHCNAVRENGDSETRNQRACATPQNRIMDSLPEMRTPSSSRLDDATNVRTPQTNTDMLPIIAAPIQTTYTSSQTTPPTQPTNIHSNALLTGEKAIQDYLQSECQTPRAQNFQPKFLKPATPPKGLVIVYHGFLGGPWQLQPIAEKLQAEGYAVLLPTMPGHGVLDANTQEITSDLVPKSDEWHDYVNYADKTLALAKGTQLPISVIGFSGGGAIANYAAKKEPSIKASVLIAPFYHPQPKWGQVLMRVVSFLDRITYNRAGRLFNKVPFDLVKKTTSVPNVKPRDPNTPAHKITSLGSIYALAQFGHHTLSLNAPMKSDCLMITSESDDQSDNKTSERMFKNIEGAKEHISLPKALKAPHVFPIKDECELEDIAEMVKDKSVKYITAHN